MAFLAPISTGWRVSGLAGVNGGVHDAATLTDAAPALASKTGLATPFSVALPARMVIFERLSLPSAEPEELASMVLLQLEKTLPYPLEETTNGYQILSQTKPGEPTPSGQTPETEFAPTLPFAAEGAPSAPMQQSVVIACAVHNDSVNALLAPLLQQNRFPEKLTIWAMHVAAQAPPAAVSCGLWQEGSDVVFAIFENGTLSFIEIISSPDHLLNELPQALMSAELAGAPTAFCAVLLDPALANLESPVSQFLEAPVAPLSIEALYNPAPGSKIARLPVDLTLSSWLAEIARLERRKKFQTQLAMAGMVYVGLLVLGFAYTLFLGQRLAALQREALAAQPKMDEVIAQKARWKALSPAIDPGFFAVELLFQVFQSIGPLDLKITEFECALTRPASKGEGSAAQTVEFQIAVKGEADDVGHAVDFAGNLKKQPLLKSFQFEEPNPLILPNGRAQFSISGKL